MNALSTPHYGLYRGSYTVANSQAILVRQWNLPSLSPKGKPRQGKYSALLKAMFHPCVANGKHRDHCQLPVVLKTPLLCWVNLVCSGWHTEVCWRHRVNLLTTQAHFHTLDWILTWVGAQFVANKVATRGAIGLYHSLRVITSCSD